MKFQSANSCEDKTILFSPAKAHTDEVKYVPAIRHAI